jgi:hypothetical protein
VILRVVTTLFALLASSCGQVTEPKLRAGDAVAAAGRSAAIASQASQSQPNQDDSGQVFRLFAECVVSKAPGKLHTAASGFAGGSTMGMTFEAAGMTGCKLSNVARWDIADGIYAQVLFQYRVGDNAEARLKASSPFTHRHEAMALPAGDERSNRLFYVAMECAVARDPSATVQMMLSAHDSQKQHEALSALLDDLSICASEVGRPIPKLESTFLLVGLETAAYRLVGFRGSKEY